MRWHVKRKLGRVTDVEDVRRALGPPRLPPPRGVTITPDTLGGVPGEWVAADGVPARATLLYLHGGGYIACSPATHRPITMAYARRGLRVFAPDYRLAPEHPYPAAVQDAAAAYRGLRDAPGRVGRIVTGGDSAGGGLAVAMMLMLRDAGDALPAAAALFSPWTDLAVTGGTIDSNTRWDAMFTGAIIRRGPEPYLGGADPYTPLASPLYADLAGLPPLLIHAGAREVLLDDSRRLAERGRAAGLAVSLSVWPVLPHVWQLAQGFVPEAARSLDEAAAFLLAAPEGASDGAPKGALHARETRPAV